MSSSRGILAVFLVVAFGALCATATSAQGRTTPVEVKNVPMVQIDPDGGKVSAVQNGEWSVGILGPVSAVQSGTWNVSVANAPTVAVSNSPTVKIDATTNTVKATQSGTWNVGVTGTVAVSGTPTVSVTNTPNVSVSNSPVVKIDSLQNVVSAPTKGNAVQLFSTNQVMPTGTQVTSPAFNCSGYKEMRFVIESDWSADTLKAIVEVQSPAGSWCIVQIQPLPIQPHAFSVPVYGANCRVRMNNNVGATATIYASSWVYMVN